MPNLAAVSASAFDPTSCTPNCAKYALQETAMARSMSSVPCAWSPTSSLMGRFQPAIMLPARPSGSVRQRNVRCLQLGIQIQRGDGGHQLECRAGRILAVARAVEQFIGRRRGGARAGRLGRGRAHHRQHVARGGVHHHHRAISVAGLRRWCSRISCARSLQADIERQVNAAVARQHARDIGIAGLMAVTRQRRQLGELVACSLALESCSTSEALVAWKFSPVRRSPTTCSVAAAEGIVARVEARAALVERDAERFVIRAMLLQFRPTAGGERDAVAVVDGRRAESRARWNSGADCAAGA